MLTRKLASALLVTAMALLGLPAAGAEETPKTFPGGGLVSIEQAKSMLDKGAQFVDSRVAAEYAEKHIKSALSVPFKEEFPKVSKTGAGDHMDAAKLPSDKNKVLIFYCNGSPCWKGYKAAMQAIKAGYKKVYWFRDGMPAWEAKGLPAD